MVVTPWCLAFQASHYLLSDFNYKWLENSLLEFSNGPPLWFLIKITSVTCLERGSLKDLILLLVNFVALNYGILLDV